MSCERLPFIPDTPDDDLVLLHQFHVWETYALHTHTFYEVFYVIRGQALHEVNGSSQAVGEGALVFIRPNDAHAYRYLNRFDFEFINVNIAPDLIEQAFSYLRLPQQDFDRPALPPSVQLSGARHAEMRYRFVALSEMAPGPARRRAFCALLPELLLALYDRQDVEPARAMPRWLADLLERLDQPDCFTRGLPSLMELTSYTQEHLTRSFRRYVHMSPTAYINQKRLSYAAELLIAGDTAPHEIAQRAGFNNLSHFYHLFRQQYGCTPLQFSQQHRDMLLSQARRLRCISREALQQCMQPNVTRLSLQKGLLAHYHLDGRAQIYVSFDADATERDVGELTACWDPRMTLGSTVHANADSPALLSYLREKLRCAPTFRAWELALSREDFSPDDASAADAHFVPLTPDRCADALALAQDALPDLSPDALDACAQEGSALLLCLGDVPVGVACWRRDELLGLALRDAFRARGLGTLLLREALRRIFSADADPCTVRLTEPTFSALSFFERQGFSLSAAEAVFLP